VSLPEVVGQASCLSSWGGIFSGFEHEHDRLEACPITFIQPLPSTTYSQMRQIKIGFGKAVSRILSARIAPGRESFVLATDTRNLFRFHETRSGPLLGFLFGLAPDGVFRAVSLALHAVVSYTTFSPLPHQTDCGGLIFCGTFRRKVFQLSACVYLTIKLELRSIAP
jgi:hypothetical protein